MSTSCHCQLIALGMSYYTSHWRDAPVTSLVTAIMVIIVRNFTGHILHCTALYILYITPLRGFMSSPSHDAVGPGGLELRMARSAHRFIIKIEFLRDPAASQALLLGMKGRGSHTQIFQPRKRKITDDSFCLQLMGHPQALSSITCFKVPGPFRFDIQHRKLVNYHISLLGLPGHVGRQSWIPTE